MITLPQNHHHPLNSFLQSVRFFQNLSEDEIKPIFDVAQLRQVEAKTVVFQQGGPADTFYVVMDGRLRMTQTSYNGQQILLRFVEAGNQLGCFALAEGSVYPGSAETVKDSLLFAWPRQTILPFLTQYPQLMLNVQSQLLQIIQNLQDDYLFLATERVEYRLAHVLLRLADRVGQEQSEGILLDLTLSRQDIAEMIGATLHTVSRILSQWHKDGLIQSGRERIVIRQPQQLQTVMLNGKDGRPLK